MKSLGIFGGGQLADMLADAARQLGDKITIYTTHADEPALTKADSTIVASLDDEQQLAAFAFSQDVLTFENEAMSLFPAIANNTLIQQRAQPHLSIMAVCSDKLQQKQLFQKLNFKSAPFMTLDDTLSVSAVIAQIAQHFPDGCVLKWARGGYDGLGVFLLKPTMLQASASAQLQQQLTEFFAKARQKSSLVYAEQLITFTKELAMVATRGSDGICAFYPLVISRQQSGVCVEVKGPATKLGVPASLEKQAQHYMQTFAEHVDYIGTFAFEFFLDADSNLLVNEIAPRVHNSGHYTLNAGVTSQFENHLRAITRRNLGSTTPASYFGMINLLGPEGFQGAADILAIKTLPGMHLTWYRKKESRTGRKLGHINFTAANESELNNQIAACIQAVKAWQQALVSGKST